MYFKYKGRKRPFKNGEFLLQMNKITQFFRDVRVELGKVVWPTRHEAIKITSIVVLFSLSVAVFLGAVDYGLQRLLGLIVK